MLEDEVRPASLPSEGQGGQMGVSTTERSEPGTWEASVVIVKHHLPYQIHLSILVVRSLEQLLTAALRPCPGCSTNTGAAGPVEPIGEVQSGTHSEGMKIYAKPQQSWSYMMKSNQPGTSVYSARSLGS